MSSPGLPLPLSKLALVHLSSSPLAFDDQGNGVLRSAFDRSGGFAQPGASPRTRRTLHFTLQAPVTDHAYGNFEHNRFMVVVPLQGVVEHNGRPETLLASDVAFLPEGALVLPRAIQVQFGSALLRPAEFARWEGSELHLAAKVTRDNADQLQAFLRAEASARPESGLAELGAQLKELLRQGEARAVKALATAVALARLDCPTLHHARGQDPLAPMAFDGWAAPAELEALAAAIEAAAPDAGTGRVRVGRHDGAGGDRLSSYAARANVDQLTALATDPAQSPRVRAFATEWTQSPLIARLRTWAILDLLKDPAVKVMDASGVERPSLARAIFTADSYQDPRLGSVAKSEVEAALARALPATRHAIRVVVQERQAAREAQGEPPHPADESLLRQLTPPVECFIPPFRGHLDALRASAAPPPPSAVPKARIP